PGQAGPGGVHVGHEVDIDGPLPDIEGRVGAATGKYPGVGAKEIHPAATPFQIADCGADGGGVGNIATVDDNITAGQLPGELFQPRGIDIQQYHRLGFLAVETAG